MRALFHYMRNMSVQIQRKKHEPLEPMLELNMWSARISKEHSPEVSKGTRDEVH